MKFRDDFPIFSESPHGRSLVYLDSAASAQTPAVVIDAMSRWYKQHYANIHRGIYQLSECATAQFEKARGRVRQFVNAAQSHEIIFTSGTTAAINLVAQSFGEAFVRAGDEIIVSEMEHHSNIVPWQMLCDRAGAKLLVIPVTDAGELDLSALETLFSPRTRLLALTHVSNVLGTVNPVKQIVQMAHSQDVPVLLDGAQAVPHLPVDVQDIGCDFYVFSAHKLYGPTGLGVLYGKSTLLEKMPPWQTGGGMISQVSFQGTTFAGLPQKFEAGTPPIAEAIGLHAAIDYLDEVGFTAIQEQERALRQATVQGLLSVPGLQLMGREEGGERVGVVSFTQAGAHAHDIATILDRAGVCVRAGHHCAMPLMSRFGLPATVRVSFGLYNTLDDVDALMAGLHTVSDIFA